MKVEELRQVEKARHVGWRAGKEGGQVPPGALWLK